VSFITCAFYTVDTPYEELIKNLIASLTALSMPYDIAGYPSTGSWVRNAGIKSQFILKMMREHQDKNILYVDADAIIHEYPVLFDYIHGDFGCYYHKGGKELLSGTLFFKNNGTCLRLLELWVAAQVASPNEWDQKILQEVITDHAEAIGLGIATIPATYVKIFDKMHDAGRPVIEHFQASRTMRGQIGGYSR